MAEVHLIGQLVGASDFRRDDGAGLFCRFNVQTGGAWKLLSGLKEGQTQVDCPAGGAEAAAFWCHPIDAHFSTRGLQGWPKLILQIFRQDAFGRNDLAGYGFCHLPTTPGSHTLDVCAWRPVASGGGGPRDAAAHALLGGGHRLRNPDLLVASADRHRLTTTTAGRAHVQLNVILRGFEKFGVEF